MTWRITIPRGSVQSCSPCHALHSANPARFTPPAEGAQHEHALIVNLSHLFDRAAVVRVRAECVAPSFRHGGTPSPHTRVGTVSNRVFDVWMCPVGGAVVAALV